MQKKPASKTKTPQIPIEKIAGDAVHRLMLNLINQHGFGTRPHWKARQNEKTIYDYACKLAAKEAAFFAFKYVSDGNPMPEFREPYKEAIGKMALQLEWRRVESENEPNERTK